MCSDGKGYLYVSGNIFNNIQVFRRPIGGGAWTADTAGIPPPAVSPNIIYFTHMAAARNGDMIATNDYTLMRRTGGMWKIMAQPAVQHFTLTALSVDSNGVIFVAVNKYNPGYAAGGEGVYYTKDFGATWIYAGLDSLTINSLVSYGDTTYALTEGNGAYILTATPAPNSVTENSARNPEIPNIQCYPNPFNITAQIQYTVVQGANVSISVVNEMGEEVAQLVNAHRETGTYSVSFDGSGLPAGVYFVRCSLGGNVVTKPVLYVR